MAADALALPFPVGRFVNFATEVRVLRFGAMSALMLVRAAAAPAQEASTPADLLKNPAVKAALESAKASRSEGGCFPTQSRQA